MNIFKFAKFYNLLLLPVTKFELYNLLSTNLEFTRDAFKAGLQLEELSWTERYDFQDSGNF